MTTALIIRNDSELSVRVSEDFGRLKAESLEQSGIIGRVSTKEELEASVEARRGIKAARKLLEDSRKAVKAPLLDCGRRVDAIAKQEDADLAAEDLRLAKMEGDFVKLEEAKARAAEAARLKDLDAIEQERQRQRAEAQSHDELDRIDYEAAQKQAELKPVEVARAEGQTVRTDWEITVLNIHKLYECQPPCVKLEPRLSEIKLVLDRWYEHNKEHFGDMCRAAGIKAERVTKSGVRLPREKGMIEA